MFCCVSVQVYVKTAKEETGFPPPFFFLLPPFSVSLPAYPRPSHFLSTTVPGLCSPLSLLGCHPSTPPKAFSVSSPQHPLAQHPVSLGWHRSAGYLGNHCRVSTCDWPGWGPTLGWWADLGSDSCPRSPLGEGHSLKHRKKERGCRGEQGSQAGGGGIPVLRRT